MEIIIVAVLALVLIILFLVLPGFFPNMWDSNTNNDSATEETNYLSESLTKLSSQANNFKDDQAIIYETEIEENLNLKKIVFIFQTLLEIAKIDGDETPEEKSWLETTIRYLHKQYDFHESIPSAQWTHPEKNDWELMVYNQILIGKFHIIEKKLIISLMVDLALYDDTFSYTKYGFILKTIVMLGLKHNKEIFNEIDVETKIIEKHPSKFDKKTLNEYKSILLKPDDNGTIGFIMAENYISEKENDK
jgi:hypothetical protein